jgi:hypothetical protein
MKYNIGDKVVIMRCPNAMYIGVVGTIVGVYVINKKDRTK